MAFYRRPSPIELSYISADTDTYSPYINQFCVEGTGDLDLETLRTAVNKVAQYLVEIRLVLKGYLKWRYWDDQGVLPRVYAVDGSVWNGQGFRNVPVSGSPMNVRTGPVCEVVLIEGDMKRILFRTHHACMDGAGMLYFLKSVFAELRGETPVPPNSRIMDWDVVEQVGYQQKQVKLGNARPAIRNPNIPLETGCIWRRVRFRGSHAGITGKVISIVAGMASPAPDERFIVRVPADLRRYLPDDQFTASNCSSAIDLEIGPDHSPKKIQHALIGALRAKQDIAQAHPNFRYVRYFPISALRLQEKQRLKCYANNRFPYSAIVTNMGEVDLGHLSCPTFTCINLFGVNIPLPLASLSVTFCHYNGEVSFIVGIPKSIGTPSDLDRICDELLARLQALDAVAAKKGDSLISPA